MFMSRIIRRRLISAWLMLCLLGLNASAAESRPASLDEIQALFDLATVGPQKLRMVADITSYEPKWTEEQIAAEINQQNERFRDLAQLPEATQRERTNAIARSHSGRRILHVQEWYSAGYYRQDQTDEGMVSEQYLQAHAGVFRNSYVNINDPVLSPYRSFFVDHQLRNAQLSKTMLYAKNDLWRALGLEGEVAFPLLVALLDTKSAPQGRPFTDAELSMLKINPSKAKLLHNGLHPTSRLEATTEDGRTRFILRGRFVSPDGISAGTPDGMSDLEFSYEVRRVGQRSVCLEASFTNHTGYSSFISKRAGFDVHGFPRVWKRTTIKPGSPPKQIDVAIKEVELNPNFKDEEVFSPTFPTNYIVSDVTSGQAVVLQKPLPNDAITQPLVHVTPVRRMIVLCVFGLVVLALGIALFRMNGNKA